MTSIIHYRHADKSYTLIISERNTRPAQLPLYLDLDPVQTSLVSSISGRCSGSQFGCAQTGCGQAHRRSGLCRAERCYSHNSVHNDALVIHDDTTLMDRHTQQQILPRSLPNPQPRMHERTTYLHNPVPPIQTPPHLSLSTTMDEIICDDGDRIDTKGPRRRGSQQLTERSTWRDTSSSNS